MFFYVKLYFLYIYIIESFITKFNFVKCFFSTYWDDHVIFILCFIVDHVDWFTDIELFLRTWDKCHLIMMHNPFNVVLRLSLILSKILTFPELEGVFLWRSPPCADCLCPVALAGGLELEWACVELWQGCGAGARAWAWVAALACMAGLGLLPGHAEGHFLGGWYYNWSPAWFRASSKEHYGQPPRQQWLK